jgi:hypothetical protein
MMTKSDSRNSALLHILSWTDLTSEDVNGVLESLEESSDDDSDTLDELGLGRIRQYYSDLFFPGISTLVRRARYVFILARLFNILREVSRPGNVLPGGLDRLLRNMEEQINRALLPYAQKETGIFGKSNPRRRFSIPYGPVLVGLLGGRFEDSSFKTLLSSLSDKSSLAENENKEAIEEVDWAPFDDFPNSVDDAIRFVKSSRSLAARPLRQLSPFLTVDEAKYLKSKMSGLDSNRFKGGLWDPLIDASRETNFLAREPRLRDLINLAKARSHELDNKEPPMVLQVHEGILFSELARTVYVAFWFHVVKPRTIGEARESSDLCETLCQRISSTSARIVLDRWLTREKQRHFLSESPDVLPTLTFLEEWMQLLPEPAQMFSVKGKNLVARRERDVKMVGRARLEGFEGIGETKLITKGQCQYMYRFPQARQFAGDIARGIQGK